MDVIESLMSKGEVGAEVVDLLFGDSAAEISKALSDRQKREQRQTRIAQASNVLGITAGVQGVGQAATEANRRYRVLNPKAASTKPLKVPRGAGAKTAVKARGTLRRVAKDPKVALGLGAGALALQGANLAGDGVTAAVLHRTAKKETVGKSIEWFGEISKTVEDKRQVFGWASITKVDGKQVEDLQGDDIDIDEIEKAAYDYVTNSRVGGNMHQKGDDGPVAVSKMIESIVINPEKKKAMGLPDDFPEGWWVGFQVDDDETWEAAKRGELAGFSIHGRGKRVPA